MNNFKQWIERQPIETLSAKIVAINFNLYETDDDEIFHSQLIACEFYDENNDDWACNPCFSSGEDIYEFKAEDWEDALNRFKELVLSYLTSYPMAFLNTVKTVTSGFVDGDIDIIVKKC